MKKRTKIAGGLLAGGLIAWLIVYLGNDLFQAFESEKPSQSVGSPAEGRLIHGKRLPSSGPGFVTYSRLGSFLGRTAVHGRVRDAVIEAYGALHAEHPETTFIYGETGWPSGGRFKPHRTHQNGLSVDFMVPVLEDGKPAVLPTSVFHKFGYAVDFDRQGQNGQLGLVIDFEAIADHLHHLVRAVEAHGLAIDVVIFAPDLQDELATTRRGAEIQRRLRFSQNPAWVRHDDHYHVNFRVVAP